MLLLAVLLLVGGCTDRPTDPDAPRTKASTAQASRDRARRSEVVRLVEQLPALRRPVHGHTILRLESSIYCLGGYTALGSGSESAALLRCDLGGLGAGTSATPWKTVSTAPFRAGFFAGAAGGGQLWFVREGIHRFDPQSRSWTSWNLNGRIPRSHHAAVWFDERLWILGGYPESASGFQVFNPADGTLRASRQPPGFTPTDHLHMLFVVDGAIHLLGGVRRQPRGLTRAHVRFDGTAWSRRAPVPVPVWRKFHVGAVHGGRIHVFGSDHGLRYDPDSDAWRSDLAALPSSLLMAQALAVGDSILVLGGRIQTSRGARYGGFHYDVTQDHWTAAGHRPR